MSIVVWHVLRRLPKPLLLVLLFFSAGGGSAGVIALDQTTLDLAQEIFGVQACLLEFLQVVAVFERKFL